MPRVRPGLEQHCKRGKLRQKSKNRQLLVQQLKYRQRKQRNTTCQGNNANKDIKEIKKCSFRFRSTLQTKRKENAEKTRVQDFNAKSDKNEITKILVLAKFYCNEANKETQERNKTHVFGQKSE